MTSPIPKYARLEYERRFLITEVPDLSQMSFRLIEDLYLDETRLRLRKITHDAERGALYKLCKKYLCEDAHSIAIVNVYLTAAEYDLLSKVGGNGIRKRRYTVTPLAPPLCIDVFEGDLAGLVLCELEAESAAVLEECVLPHWIGKDVSDDPFFRGGNLASINVSQLTAKMSSVQS